MRNAVKVEKRNEVWKKVFGMDLFKIQYYLKFLLYKLFRIKLPKLKDQRIYWNYRGQSYMQEVFEWGYHDREIFFQNMMIEDLRQMDFRSFFEAGCGFGWNIGRVKTEFPSAIVGGLDFSFTQLKNSQQYLGDIDILRVNGDNCMMPLKDNIFDVGFSLGVFMNIHPSRIKMAIQEMIRVSSKYIIHIEYDENYTSPKLREQRKFKTNIISHDYKELYESFGMEVIKFQTFQGFGKAFLEFERRNVNGKDGRWEGFEGPEKYIYIVVKVQK